MNDEFGWVFIYVFAFGFSDLFVKKYIKSEKLYILYYAIIAIIGFTIINLCKNK